ncbi:MAG: peptidylprolyl isomerase [Planctomycetes bacterium]|nr:peptidylprolyl isomerase [Planctomycetota bacterium]
MGRFREARDLLSEALKRSPSDGRAKAYAGLIAFDLFEDAVARETLREAAKAEASLRPGLAVRVLIALQELDLRAQEERKNDLPRVELETPKGKIVLELFEDQAPNTVANFISLVGDGFYDGTQFHRVESNFVIQGGDPLSKNDDPTDDGLGGPGYRFPDELPAGYRRHFRGSLSMANSGPGTNGSQFFITHRVTEPLDGRHTVFGRVLEGMPVVDAIAVGDRITHAHVVRKRPHEYAVQGIIREPSADQHDH